MILSDTDSLRKKPHFLSVIHTQALALTFQTDCRGEIWLYQLGYIYPKRTKNDQKSTGVPNVTCTKMHQIYQNSSGIMSSV